MEEILHQSVVIYTYVYICTYISSYHMFLYIRSQVVEDLFIHNSICIVLPFPSFFVVGFHSCQLRPFKPSRCRASGATSRKGRGSGWQVRRMPWFMENPKGAAPKTRPQCRVETQGMMVAPSSLMKARISWNDIPPSSVNKALLMKAPCFL